MKKILSLILAAVLMLSLCACGITPAQSGGKTVMFTDSLGREVEIPADITRVAPSGNVANMFMLSIAPEYMVCISNEIHEDQEPYFLDGIADLPITGQLYGSKSTLNLEQLLSTEPQVIIDIGDYKKGMEEDLDALQEQTGLPVVFLKGDLQNMADSFRTLGTLLSGKAERGGKIGKFIDETVAMAEASSAKISDDQRVSVMFTCREDGLSTNARGSTQSQVLDIVGAENAIVVEELSNKGGGNVINMEQLYNFNPELIIFGADSIYDTVADDEAWQQLDAIKNGNFYEIPALPYNFMSEPPSVNMILGIWWCGNLVYPEIYDYNVIEKLQEAYDVFWEYELTETEAREMLSKSNLK